MNTLPLNALRAFAMVYSSGGVRAAARQLAVAHSAVSRHLKELESWLGVPLMHARSGRGEAVFTAQGEALGRAVLAGLDDIQQAVTMLREARSPHSVIVSTTSSFAARWLLPRLPALQAAHRDIEVSVLVDQKLVDLNLGEQDFAIRIGRGRWPGLRCECLMDDTLYPVMSPALWQSAGRPDMPAALRRLRLLHDRDPFAGWAAWKQRFGPPSLDVRKGPRFTSSDLVLRAAMHGQGVALARHQLVRDEVAAGLLVAPMGTRYVELGPAYWIVQAQRMPTRPAIATVVAWLKVAAK